MPSDDETLTDVCLASDDAAFLAFLDHTLVALSPAASLRTKPHRCKPSMSQKEVGCDFLF
jgi:hypothetical protein